MKNTIFMIISIFVFGCVHTPPEINYETPKQQALRKANDKKQRIALHNLLEVNTIYAAFSDPKTLKAYENGECKKKGRLVIDPRTNLFVVNNESDRICLKKWSDDFVKFLNEKYTFSILEVDYKVSYISDTSTLHKVNFKNLETFTRYMYKNAFIHEANRLQKIRQQQELEQIMQAERENQERQRRSAAIISSANAVGRAISGSYQNPQPVNNYTAPNNNYGNGGKLYSNDGKYLGNINGNQYDPNSTSNPYGKYGSEYSADSINNPNGKYGSQYSNESVNNPYGSGAKVYSNDGKYLGNVNGNQYDPNSTSNPYGKYGSEYSTESINNPYGTYGNPYSNQYVPNNFGK